MQTSRPFSATRIRRATSFRPRAATPLRVAAIAAATACQASFALASDITVANTTPSPITVSTPFALDGVGNITFSTQPGNITYTAQITDTGVNGLIKTGPGILVLSAANQYNGTTRLNGGTLALLDPNAIGSGAIAFAGGALIYAGTFSTDFSSRFAPIPASVSAIVDLVSNDVTFASSIGGAGGLEKRGAGTLTLSAANTYAGPTTLTAGTLRLANPDALPSGAPLKFTGGTLDLNGNSLRVSALSGTKGTIANTTAATAATLTFDGNTATSSFAGSLNDNISLDVASGTLTLSGANTFTGSTTLEGGTLVAGSAGALGSGAILFRGGTLGYTSSLHTDFSSRIAPIPSNVSAQLDIASGNNVTFASPLTGSGGLTKLGWGTLTLATANSYAGTTLLTRGTLSFQNNDALGTGPIVFNGGTLQYGPGLSPDLSARFLPIAAGVSAAVDVGSSNVVFSTPIQGAGGFTLKGTGTLSLAPANTFTGPLALDGGTLISDPATINSGDPTAPISFNGGALSITGNLATARPLSMDGPGSIFTNGYACTLAGPLSGTGYLAKYGLGTLTLSGSGPAALSLVDQGQVVVRGSIGNDYVVVARNAQATLTITDGGSVAATPGSSGGAIIAQYPGSQGLVEVTGPGSQFQTGGNALYVGYGGTGALHITNGAQAQGGGSNARDCYVGYNASSSGSVTVDGPGSTLNVTSNDMYIGYAGSSGTVSLTNGGQLIAAYGTFVNVGYSTGATGTLAISGSGSKLLSPHGQFYVGTWINGTGRGSITLSAGATAQTYTTIIALQGSATVQDPGSAWTIDNLSMTGASSLNVSNGATLSTTGALIGTTTGSPALLSLDGPGTTWLLGSMHLGESGAGTVSLTHGAHVVSGFGILGYNAGSAGTALIRDSGTVWDTQGQTMSVGYYGSGNLQLRSGATLATGDTELGGARTGNGVVAISDSATAWNCSGTFTVGGQGAGFLSVSNGAHLATSSVQMAADNGFGAARGVATVQGPGSAWTVAQTLSMGFSGPATLNLADHATVAARVLSAQPAAYVNLYVSGDGMLVLGDAATPGQIANSGTVNLVADLSLAPGTYRPIVDAAGRAMTWSGTGSYLGFGGTWDATAKTFTVPAPLLSTPGQSTTPHSGTRLIIADGTTPLLSASFSTVGAATRFSAARMQDAELSSLPLDPGASVLAAWDFSTDLSNTRVLLSFETAPHATDLHLWHYANGTWTGLPANDLVYYDGLATFSVNSFSGYALTGIAPEPSALLLSLTSAALLLSRRRRPAPHA